MRRFLFPALGAHLMLVMGCAGKAAGPAPPAQSSAALSAASPSYTLFESGQVRPLAMSPSGRILFAANTPDARLEVYGLHSSGIVHQASIPVGLEPVAVAARSDNEAWVVNHLSDSVSIVRLNDDASSGQVVRTLLVGDEPRDIVLAANRAFITTAHRGQNAPYDPQLTTPGIGRADVWVFDADHPGTSLTGTPLTILNLFADTPRALAVSPDGLRVYAAGFHSGNQTTSISALFAIFRGTPPPFTNFEGKPGPLTGMVLQLINGHWVDNIGRVFDDSVNFNLPDKDVFVIDATANPPRQLDGNAGYYTGVGTILFNMAVNPVNGHIYVSNLDSQNHVRFEGPGGGGSTVRGHNVESRISVLASGAVSRRHLNKHIDYSQCCADLPNDENARSLAFPQGMAISHDGSTLYVSALGSSKVGIFDTAQLENDTFVPSTANQVVVTGGGPTGVQLDEARRRLYVLTRFDDSISVISTDSRSEIDHVAMHNPEPTTVTKGRRFLYDAAFTSSHGDQACAGCHIFADFDSLAWDLGNPDNPVVDNLNPFIGQVNLPKVFHPMKGPMTTQSLRGMANNGPMHWRGDRTGSFDAPNIAPDSGSYDEDAAFKKFNVAFAGLVGRSGPLSDDDMQSFTDFILQVSYPPNPIRHLDQSLTATQQAGSDFFRGPNSFRGVPCSGCHVEDPALGAFGTTGLSSDSDEPDLFKVPHLRNLYQKVGMFGMPEVPFGLVNPIDNDFKGDQVRGVGFNHDGSFDTVFRFNNVHSFDQTPDNPDGISVDDAGMQIRRNLEDYMLAFESNLAPIVGQQATLDRNGGSDAIARVALLTARAGLGECDLIAKAMLGGFELGFLYSGNDQFRPNLQAAPPVSGSGLRDLALLTPVTYTCVPPGNGVRLGIDRDLDGVLDGDEQVRHSDPADPRSN
jgi:DNA-binding beta-propeller fold protein YncE